METLSALIAMRASKGPRIVERGGVALVVRSLLLYGDGDEDGGDSEITMSAMNVLLGLLRTSPESAAPKLLESWPIKTSPRASWRFRRLDDLKRSVTSTL